MVAFAMLALIRIPNLNIQRFAIAQIQIKMSREFIIFFFDSQGAGRVAFSNQQSYIAAISARFVQLQHGDIDKRVEVKPYVLDDQMCDECQGSRCGGKFAPFFCANVTCLQVSHNDIDRMRTAMTNRMEFSAVLL